MSHWREPADLMNQLTNGRTFPDDVVYLIMAVAIVAVIGWLCGWRERRRLAGLVTKALTVARHNARATMVVMTIDEKMVLRRLHEGRPVTVTDIAKQIEHADQGTLSEYEDPDIA